MSHGKSITPPTQKEQDQLDREAGEILNSTGLGTYNRDTFKKVLTENKNLTLKTQPYITLHINLPNYLRVKERLIKAGWMTPEELIGAGWMTPEEPALFNKGGNRRRYMRTKKYKKNTKRSTRALRSKRYSRKT